MRYLAEFGTRRDDCQRLEDVALDLVAVRVSEIHDVGIDLVRVLCEKHKKIFQKPGKRNGRESSPQMTSHPA
jgi:hypothetical protein